MLLVALCYSNILITLLAHFSGFQIVLVCSDVFWSYDHGHVHGAFDFGIYNCMYRNWELKLTRTESISKAFSLLVCSLISSISNSVGFNEYLVFLNTVLLGKLLLICQKQWFRFSSTGVSDVINIWKGRSILIIVFLVLH